MVGLVTIFFFLNHDQHTFSLRLKVFNVFLWVIVYKTRKLNTSFEIFGVFSKKKTQNKVNDFECHRCNLEPFL